MRAHVFAELLHKKMAEKGLGGKEITCNGGFQQIIDVNWCIECNQFHIVTEPTDDARELLHETTKTVQTSNR